MRIFNLLKIVATKHVVDLITFSSDPVPEDHQTKLLAFCGKIACVPYRSYNPRSFQSLLGLFSRLPRYLFDTYSKEYERRIRNFISSNSYDLVIMSETDLTPYLPLLRNHKVILDELQLSVWYEAGRGRLTSIKNLRNAITWEKHWRYVRQVLQTIDGCTMTSQKEKSLIASLSDQVPLEVIPNGVDRKLYAEAPEYIEKDSLIYAGALSYFANLDAVNFFIGEILPAVKKYRPEVKLYVTGRLDAANKTQVVPDDAVVLTGYLDDVRIRIAQSWISIVPLRIGGGTRLKILESLALGTPVVSTSKGAEGLLLSPGSEIIIADRPEDFAKAIVELLNDPVRRSALSACGREAVIRKYDWQPIGVKFLAFIQNVVDS